MNCYSRLDESRLFSSKIGFMFNRLYNLKEHLIIRLLIRIFKKICCSHLSIESTYLMLVNLNVFPKLQPHTFKPNLENLLFKLLVFFETNKQNIVLVSGQALCASDTISLQSKPLEILQIFLITQNRGQPLRHRPQ